MRGVGEIIMMAVLDMIVMSLAGLISMTAVSGAGGRHQHQHHQLVRKMEDREGGPLCDAVLHDRRLAPNRLVLGGREEALRTLLHQPDPDPRP